MKQTILKLEKYKWWMIKSKLYPELNKYLGKNYVMVRDGDKRTIYVQTIFGHDVLFSYPIAPYTDLWRGPVLITKAELDSGECTLVPA